MKYFDVNRDGVNARLLDKSLSEADRDYIKSTIRPYTNNRRFVRVEDGERIRKLLDVPADIEVKEVRF